jgi:hypothetical protein
LLAACVPGLLMLATFGLEKLESGLVTDTPADDLTELIEMSEARAEHNGRVCRRADPDFPAMPALRSRLGALDDEPGLPTRRYPRRSANPQFQPSRHANRV